jgi:hypothetical protein
MFGAARTDAALQVGALAGSARKCSTKHPSSLNHQPNPTMQAPHSLLSLVLSHWFRAASSHMWCPTPTSSARLFHRPSCALTSRGRGVRPPPLHAHTKAVVHNRSSLSAPCSIIPAVRSPREGVVCNLCSFSLHHTLRPSRLHKNGEGRSVHRLRLSSKQDQQRQQAVAAAAQTRGTASLHGCQPCR